MDILTYAPLEPGGPCYNLRIDHTKISDKPRSYLLSAVTLGTGKTITREFATISFIGDWYISARVDGVNFETIEEAKRFFADNIKQYL